MQAAMGPEVQVTLMLNQMPDVEGNRYGIGLVGLDSTGFQHQGQK